MAKKGFVLYNDQKEVIDELDNEQAGKLFKAIYEYNVNKKVTLTGALKIIFIPFKTSFDRDSKKWEEISKLRSEAGKRHRGNQHTRKKQELEQMEQVLQNGTNGTVSVSVSGSVKDSVNVNVSDSVSVNNIPDTPNTIFQFCISLFENYNENDLKKSCTKFFNYYKEKNWKGVNNWQEKLELWINDDIDNGKIKEKEQEDDYIDEAGFHYRNGRRIL